MRIKKSLKFAIPSVSPQGIWEIRYDLRAEVPGHFHALPLLGEAMYVPEIRANGAEIRLEVIDREDQ
ncbi:MAG: hypothetical protein KKD94_02520 [Nanoarchaeota archaeon]|nr:hypothetical protein [Nanoarchaeota archaeon]